MSYPFLKIAYSFEDCILLYVICVCLDPKGNKKIHVAEFLLNLRLRTSSVQNVAFYYV